MPILTAAALFVAAPALSQPTTSIKDSDMTVSPALENANRDEILGRLWRNEALSARDRGLATVAVLVARNQTDSLAEYTARALDSGVKPSEISEVLYHLAYYAGWQNAMEAAPRVAEVFEARGVDAAPMPPADPSDLLPLDEEAEAQRQKTVQDTYGSISQGVVDDTTRLLFQDLWLRPALAPRDRSLVTVAALVAAGQTEQIGFHLNRAMDNGLTRPEASELLHHLAFYAGWPNVFSAMPVAGEVFQKRQD
ncbi:4-carboxymuconolactone decarboxylase [Novosphingobium sp. PC22D]|nr:4-carboxymuconolactone decarboxylase [Novosphingobium sp. PC22D]